MKRTAIVVSSQKHATLKDHAAVSLELDGGAGAATLDLPTSQAAFYPIGQRVNITIEPKRERSSKG